MKKSEQSLARISIIFSVHLGILTPKKSFAKNNTNSDLSSGFVLFACGGDKGIRTPGLRIANATLYQLSHIPTFCAQTLPFGFRLLGYYITFFDFGNKF